MTDMDDAPAIQLCFCPPMPDPDDPEQHRAGCYHAEVLYRRAFWDRVLAETVEARPTACYEASFGWVHVRPGCRCKGGRR